MGKIGLKLLGTILAVAGAGVTIASHIVADKVQEDLIAKKVAEAVAKAMHK